MKTKSSTKKVVGVPVMKVIKTTEGFQAGFMDSLTGNMEPWSTKKGRMTVLVTPTGDVVSTLTGEFLADGDVKLEALKLYELFILKK